MIRMRVELRNKISLNKFTHSQLELEKEFMSPDDASLFFDVDRTVTHSP